MIRIICIAVTLLLSSQAFGWTMSSGFGVIWTKPTAATQVYSPPSESDDIARGDAQAEVFEQGSSADIGIVSCTRSSSSAPVSCQAEAIDETPTQGCEYCAEGFAQVFDLIGQIWIQVDNDSWDSDDEPCFDYEFAPR